MNNQLKKRIIRKCWIYIAQIRTSHNMLQIESAISNAMVDVFGQRNMGIQKVMARKEGTFDQLMKRVKFKDQEINIHKKEIMRYLITFIPERMQITRMYKELAEKAAL